MRNSLFFLLLATAAVAAFAADTDSDRAARREAARAERAEAHSERQAERAQPPQRSEPQAARSLEPRTVDRPAVREQQREMIQQRVLEHRSSQNLGSVPPRPTLEQRRETVDSVRNWRQQERQQVRANGPKAVVPPAGSVRESFRERRAQRIEARDAIGNRRAPIISRTPREGTQPPPPPASTRPSSLTASHWNSGWRSNHHYDWQNHRRHHHSLFHFGFYYDPFGWGYRPYSIGWRLWPSYYRSSYWLNDPWMYRLPYAPPGYRWIRYYDDALLVDMWDGQVVDVIYDFFW